ncbi:MAG: hypothetical protein KGZ71_04495 [Desulfobulbaceae bacterium]|nr:hypothetical protein [Candidatus Kapabacteria bacterium]MBS3999722.1 hypothetical protein [Desulfobulbaceae bacterium]
MRKSNKENSGKKLVKSKSEDKILKDMMNKDMLKRIQNKIDSNDSNFLRVFKSILKSQD